VILPISASQVAGITSVNHHDPPVINILNHYGTFVVINEPILIIYSNQLKSMLYLHFFNFALFSLFVLGFHPGSHIIFSHGFLVVTVSQIFLVFDDLESFEEVL
jgi:hypothetical protein